MLLQAVLQDRMMKEWCHCCSSANEKVMPLLSMLLQAVLQDGGGPSPANERMMLLLLEAGLQIGGGSSPANENVMHHCHCCWKLSFRMELGLHLRLRKWHITVTVLESQLSVLWWSLWGGWQCVAETCRGCDWTPWCPWAFHWTRTWWTLTSGNLHTSGMFTIIRHKE